MCAGGDLPTNLQQTGRTRKHDNTQHNNKHSVSKDNGSHG